MNASVKSQHLRLCLMAITLSVGLLHCTGRAIAQYPASVTAPSGFQPCADSASSTPPAADSSPYTVDDTLTAMHTPSTSVGAVTFSAHRGFWQNAPENSMTAIYEGIRNHIRVNEVDVFETSDDLPVLSHDNDIARTTTGTGLISSLSHNQYLSYYLRDRHGCPTNEDPVTLAKAISNLIGTGQIYVDDDQELAGSVLVVDVKGTTASAVYENLLDSIAVWENNGVLINYGVAEAVVFKVPLNLGLAQVMPNRDTCDKSGKCGYYKFLDDIGAKLGTQNFARPNMVYVLYAPANTDPNDTYVEEYEVAWKPRQGGTMAFETHERYLNDQMTEMRQYLASIGLGINSFSPDNFFPEGDPSGNVCCKLFNMSLSAATQPDCLNGGVGSCLDERVRWDFQLLTNNVNADFLTLERPLDAQNYVRAITNPTTPLSVPPPE